MLDAGRGDIQLPKRRRTEQLFVNPINSEAVSLLDDESQQGGVQPAVVTSNANEDVMVLYEVTTDKMVVLD